MKMEVINSLEKHGDATKDVVLFIFTDARTSERIYICLIIIMIIIITPWP
jgi:hypothetical protein